MSPTISLGIKPMPVICTVSAASSESLGDMHGSVWEWVQDYYDQHYYQNSPATDPVNSTGSIRVLRGGCWSCNLSDLRSAFRGSLAPRYRYDMLGFRLVKQL